MRRLPFVALALALAAPAAAEVTPAPPEAARVVAAPAALAPIVTRVRAHRVRLGDGVLALDDVAGDGAPWVGVVERRGADLWLVTALGALRLAGPLARPRLAGPGYLVWAQGRVAGDTLRVRRLGVLAPPPQRRTSVDSNRRLAEAGTKPWNSSPLGST